MSTSRGFSSGLVRGAALMAVATLLACSVTVDSRGGTQNTALIDRLPAGASAIAWFDFEALAESLSEEEWAKYEDMIERDEDSEQIERFAEMTGIDLREDLKQVAVAVMPGAADGDDPLLLSHVAYDEDKLMELLEDAETVTYEDHTIYRANEAMREVAEAFEDEDESSDAEAGEPEAAEPDLDVILGSEEEEQPAYLVMLDDRTLATGNMAALELVIDVDDGRREALKADAEMNDLISDVAGQGQIWFVATRDTWDDQLSDLEGAGGMVPTNAVESIEIVTMSMRLGGGMAMRLAGVAASAEDAGLLADTLRGWTAMGKMALQQSQPELFRILDRGISVGLDDRTVHIEATLSQEDIELLERLAEEQLSAGDVVGSEF